MPIHIDIEDSASETPGIGITVALDGVNNPTNVDLVSLANDILNSDVIQHITWSGHAILLGVNMDSQTTLYPTE